MQTEQEVLFPEIKTWINHLETSKLNRKRIEILEELGKKLLPNFKNQNLPDFHFLCTHNSRRSQISQAITKVLAIHYGLSINCFSGGTVETSFHPNAIDCLQSIGFKIEKKEILENQWRYQLHFSQEIDGLPMWSKLLDDPYNPKKNFIAIFTCDQAAETCPVVSGSLYNAKLGHSDPKIFDGTANEKEGYLKCAVDIATEMKWLFHFLASN